MTEQKNTHNAIRILDFGSTQTRIEFVESYRGLYEADSANTLVVCDENTLRYIPSSRLEPVVLPPGEPYKNIESVQLIIRKCLDANMGRDDRILGIGGGVVCDTAAFAASIFMRGCKLTLAPTTVLSMVDAALGGKTGVDYGGAKNVVGSFYPAGVVHLCPDVLDTLPDREYTSGLAEGIKHALLADPALLRMFENNKTEVVARDRSCVEQMVLSSVRVKGDIVEEDLRESGVRAHLNLGHTFGHALEAATGYTVVTHGEAVAWGIVKSLKLGLLLNMTDRSYAIRVQTLLESYGYRLNGIPFAIDGVLDFMRADKKRLSGKLRFIVQRALEQTTIVGADVQQIVDVLNDESTIK